MNYIFIKIENVFGTVKENGSAIIEGTVIVGIEGDIHGFTKQHPFSIPADINETFAVNYQKLVEAAKTFINEQYN